MLSLFVNFLSCLLLLPCKDINECATNNGGCESTLYCVNTIGNFTCSTCPQGFIGNDDDECVGMWLECASEYVNVSVIVSVSVGVVAVGIVNLPSIIY